MPADAAEKLCAYIDGQSDEPLVLWWMPWLNNAVGFPFAALFLLIMLGYVKMAWRRIRQSQ